MPSVVFICFLLACMSLPSSYIVLLISCRFLARSMVPHCELLFVLCLDSLFEPCVDNCLCFVRLISVHISHWIVNNNTTNENACETAETIRTRELYNSTTPKTHPFVRDLAFLPFALRGREARKAREAGRVSEWGGGSKRSNKSKRQNKCPKNNSGIRLCAIVCNDSDF